MEDEIIEFIFNDIREAMTVMTDMHVLKHLNKLLRLSDVYKLIYKDNKDINEYYDNFGWYSLQYIEINEIENGKYVLKMPKLVLLDKNMEILN